MEEEVGLHMRICAIVYAEDEDEACSEAESVFEDLVDGSCLFDYYTMYDEKTVFRADSPDGKRLINQGMDATRNDFLENLNKVRESLEVFSDEEIFNERAGEESKITLTLKNDKYTLSNIHGMLGFYFHCLARDPGPHVWLYNKWGAPIENPDALKRTLKKHNDEASKDLTVFVVPCDVHY